MSDCDPSGLLPCFVEAVRSGWRLSRCPENARPGKRLSHRLEASQFDGMALAEAEQQPELRSLHPLFDGHLVEAVKVVPYLHLH